MSFQSKRGQPAGPAPRRGDGEPTPKACTVEPRLRRRASTCRRAIPEHLCRPAGASGGMNPFAPCLGKCRSRSKGHGIPTHGPGINESPLPAAAGAERYPGTRLLQTTGCRVRKKPVREDVEDVADGSGARDTSVVAQPCQGNGQMDSDFNRIWSAHRSGFARSAVVAQAIGVLMQRRNLAL
jgi:hypothetical protein